MSIGSIMMDAEIMWSLLSKVDRKEHFKLSNLNYVVVSLMPKRQRISFLIYSANCSSKKGK